MARAQNTTRPANLTVEELRQYLTEVEGKTATQRIMVGINHKEGIPQTKLADWYDVSRTTIHNWLSRLERLEDEPLERVIYDEERPGRPAKLDAEERDRLYAVLDDPPTAVGYDASTWTPQLVQAYIADTFDVDYCLSYVRELLREREPPRETDDSVGTDASVARPEEEPDEGVVDEQPDDDPGTHRVHGCRS